MTLPARFLLLFLPFSFSFLLILSPFLFPALLFLPIIAHCHFLLLLLLPIIIVILSHPRWDTQRKEEEKGWGGADIGEWMSVLVMITALVWASGRGSAMV